MFLVDLVNSLFVGMPIPIAIIVCEGDVQTVAHTAEALQHRLPVIIMKGSGKAADLILVYLERFAVFITYSNTCFSK